MTEETFYNRIRMLEQYFYLILFYVYVKEKDITLNPEVLLHHC